MSTLNSPRDGSSRRTNTGSVPVAGDGTAWEETQASPEFQHLKHSLRRFAFPATAAFLGWYLLYVVMSGYARGFMDTKLMGNINVAYVFGLLQFVSTFALAYLYSRYADKHLDPTADAIRGRLEGGHR